MGRRKERGALSRQNEDPTPLDGWEQTLPKIGSGRCWVGDLQKWTASAAAWAASPIQNDLHPRKPNQWMI
eukprot:9233364-Pyramimonas_sp.AAC.1